MSSTFQVDSAEHLNTLIETCPNVVVDFQALDWCVPCQRFAPVFQQAAAQNPNIVFVEVDVDTNPWAREYFGVMSVPTIKQYSGGSFVQDLKPAPLAKFVVDLNS